MGVTQTWKFPRIYSSHWAGDTRTVVILNALGSRSPALLRVCTYTGGQLRANPIPRPPTQVLPDLAGILFWMLLLYLKKIPSYM